MRAGTCGRSTASGEPCRVDYGLCESCGACYHHDPHRAEERAERNRRGGLTTAAKIKAEAGPVTEDELPPIRTHDDAEARLDFLHRAAALSRLPASSANAAIRGVEAWVKARADKLKSVELVKLRDAVASLEAENDRLRRELARR